MTFFNISVAKLSGNFHARVVISTVSFFLSPPIHSPSISTFVAIVSVKPTSQVPDIWGSCTWKFLKLSRLVRHRHFFKILQYYHTENRASLLYNYVNFSIVLTINCSFYNRNRTTTDETGPGMWLYTFNKELVFTFFETKISLHKAVPNACLITVRICILSYRRKACGIEHAIFLEHPIV